MILFEFFKENETVIVNKFKDGGEKYSQICYLHSGKKFPEEFVFPLQQGQSFYRAGLYELQPKSLRVGKYSRLELNPYEMHILPYSGDKKLAQVS